MQRLLTPRHVTVSALSGLLVFVLFTSVIGAAKAQDDTAPPAPATISTAGPRFGDEITYNVSGTLYQVPEYEHYSEEEICGDVVGCGTSCPGAEACYDHTHNEAPEPELVAFGPVDYSIRRTGDIGTLRDAQGVLHDVEYIEWGVTPQHVGSAPLAHVLGSGVALGYHGAWSESESATWDPGLDPVVQSESYSAEYEGAFYHPVDPTVPCVLRHGFQGSLQVINVTSDAFGPCSLIGTDLLWSGAPMQIMGVETDDGVPMLHLRGVSEEMELDVWLDPEVPYPARMSYRFGEEHIDIQATEYQAGSEDALAFVDTPRDALGPMQVRAREPAGMSFDGIGHPFPPQEAHQAAYDDPFDSTFRQWADANPDHTVLSAFYSTDYREGSDAVPTQTWYLDLGAEHARGSLEVVRRTVEAADGQEEHVHETRFGGFVDTSETFPMPSNYPHAADLLERWNAYLPDGYLVQPTMYHWEEDSDAWVLMAMAYEEGSDVPLVYGVGDYRYHMEDGQAVFTSDGTLLMMDHGRFTTEGGTKTIVSESVPERQESPDGEPAPPTVLQASTDSVWVPPTPAQAAGAAGVAVATGLLVYLWPLVKGLPMFGLFSRIDRPKALDHPSRRAIFDTVEEEPGIHFQELLRRTGLSNGNLVHHVGKLCQTGLLTKTHTGGYTCYFVAKDADRNAIQAAPALRSDAARHMMGAIRSEPGINAQQLAARLGLGSSTVHYHLKRLQSVGLAHAERNGRTLEFFATEKGRKTVQAV